MRLAINYISASSRQVFLYIPNQIAYIRIVLLMLFLGALTAAPCFALGCYVVFALLDALDGTLARALHQTSALGALLDFTIDRVGQAALLIVLIRFFPEQWLPLTAVLLLDLFSHFGHLYQGALTKIGSHKQVCNCKSRLLLSYYQRREILFSTCLLYELWLCSLLAYALLPCAALAYVVLLGFPGFLIKLYIHLLQAVHAFRSAVAVRA